MGENDRNMREIQKMRISFLFDNEGMEEEKNDLIPIEEQPFEVILEKHRKMIYSIINSLPQNFGEHVLHREDLFQEAAIALYNATKRYKKQENVKFSTYVYTAIKRTVIRVYNEDIKIYKNEAFSIDDNLNFISADRVEDTALLYHYEREREEELNRKLSKLRKQDREILLLRINNYSYAEIAEKLNVNKKRIDNRITRLRKRYLCENNAE